MTGVTGLAERTSVVDAVFACVEINVWAGRVDNQRVVSDWVLCCGWMARMDVGQRLRCMPEWYDWL